MTTHYKHLSLEDREKLFVYKVQGLSLRQIARKLGKSHSTLSRELKRNTDKPLALCSYQPYCADKKYRKRKLRPSCLKLLNHSNLKRYVYANLKRGWSPELIAGRLALDHPDLKISHETIYRFIYARDHALIPHLARRHRRRRKRVFPRNPQAFPPIPNRISIDQRSLLINERAQFGHWEADSVVSRNNSVSLHVLCERKTRYIKISKILRNNSKTVASNIISRLSYHPKFARRSITYDNGPENYLHSLVNDSLKTNSYFCYPYHSWQKGSVENVIGLIRRFFPKKADIQKISSSDVRVVEYLLNTRPRKCLNFKTPKELFQHSLTGALEM